MGKLTEYYGKSKKFLKEVWQEVDPKKGKVAWPDKQSIINSTIIVIVCVVIVSLYIAFCDKIFSAAVQLVTSGIN